MKKALISFAVGLALLGASATSASAEEYQVEEGDTLSAIGQEYNVSVDNLKSWNDLTSDLIIVDQKLDIKDGKSSNNVVEDGEQVPQAEREQEETNNEAIEEETVEKSDDEGVETKAAAEEQSKEENVEQQATEQDENTAAATEENEVSEEEQQATPEDNADDQEATQEESNDEENAEQQATEQDENTAAATEENEVSEEEQQATPEDNADDQEATQEESNNEENDEASGETMTMSATAYTADCNGCSGTTADGTALSGDENVIAVDPDKIPLGSEVHVEGYGDAVAADTGGAINGDKIDLHMGDAGEAQAWGNQEVEVTVK